MKTERPYKYELDLNWPNQTFNLSPCFSSFSKNFKTLTIVSEFTKCPLENNQSVYTSTKSKMIQMDDLDNYNNFLTNLSELASLSTMSEEDEDSEDVEENDDIDESYKLGKEDVYLINNCDNNGDTQTNQYAQYKKSMKIKNKSKNTNLHVSFSSHSRCIMFGDQEPVNEISSRSDINIPMKSKDGCSSKKFINPLGGKNSQKKNKSNKGNNNVGGGKRNKKKRNN